LTDAAHCGACGTVCNTVNGTPTCAQGSCGIAACDAGYRDCDQLAFNGCEVSSTSDVNHCGGCGVVCPARPSAVATCLGSACGYACVAGRLDCDGVASNGCEVDTTASNNHCGACGVVCTQGRTCQSGACTTAVCVAGSADCDHDPANGCEVNLSSNAAHCSACGSACAYANGTGVCAAGSCALGACAAGWADCNASSADGCELNIANNVNHCGACGRVCPSSNGVATCVAGACGMSSCNAGFVLSGGACVDINECASNNGGCGANATCTNTPGSFSCACNAGFARCGGVCTSITTLANCGACGNVCGYSQACSAGTCVNTICTPPPRCSGSACPVCTQAVFSENWESGIGAWRSIDSRPITVASASPQCAGTYLHETAILPQGGGRLFTIAPVPVVGGQTYCLSAWVRGTPGAVPYVGFHRSNAAGVGSIYEQFWGLGGCGDSDYQGGVITPMVSDNTWRWYPKQMVMPAGWTHVLLRLQLFSGPVGSAADFDQVQLVEGPCPADPPTTCAAVTCERERQEREEHQSEDGSQTEPP
jgi:hypothetical protein